MKTKATLMFALLVACSAGDNTDYSVDELGTRKGIDYAWARPSISGMKAEGYTFAARYLSWDTTGKNLSYSEAKDLRAAGIDVVVVWESSATSVLGGYGQGVSDAKEAESQAKSDGQPAGRPIYFAIDFDASSSQQGTINSYFDGVASVIGRDRTGVYAGYGPVNRLFNDGKIKYAWQTYAWSYGQWDSRAQLRQVLNDITAGGSSACCDKDQAVAADFGQWGYNGGGGGFDLSETGPVIARNPDGRLEAFARGSDDSLWHTAQTSAGGAWGAWSGLGGKLTCDPAVGVNQDGTLEVFYRGTDAKLYHLWQTTPGGSTYTSHYELGGSGTLDTGGVTVVTNTDGRLEVFGRGTNKALYHIAQTAPEGAWTGWEGLGGTLDTNVAVGINKDGRLEAFYRGTDSAIWHLWQTTPGGSTWTKHSSLGGFVDPSVAVGRNADGRLEVFVRGTDAAVYHIWQESPGGAWSKWASFGGNVTSDITVSNDQDGHLEVFALGSDSSVFHIYEDSTGWSSWSGLGGKSTSNIGLAPNADGRLEAFYRGTDGALWHLWQKAPNAGWSDHYSLGGKIQP